MKKIFSKIYWLLSMTLILCFVNSYVFAGGSIDFTSVVQPLTEITQILLIIATGVCVCKIIHIGILFVTSSAAEKSNAKMALMPWVIGTFICFGAAVIGPAIISILSVGMDVLEY